MALKSKSSMAEPVKNDKGISKSMFFIALAVVSVMGFAAGARQYEVYAAVAQVFGVKVSTETIDTSSLQVTFRQLKNNFDGPLDSSKLIEGANRGMVEAVGDPHTVFMSEEEARQFNNDLSGSIGGGIGAELSATEDRPSIVRVLADQPAEQVGLRAGDVITKVNNDDTLGWSVEEAVQKIRGEIGSSVKIQILRGEEQRQFSITRANIVNPSVNSRVKDGLGVLTISRFDGETTNLARKAAEEFKRQDVKGVVVDLRNNGGGFLSASQGVAGIWLDNKVVVSERRGGEVKEELRSRRSPILQGVPTVVLVNKSSASASEIVAGALQDHGVATIIGESTFGKGTVQRVVNLSRGAELKVTIASWYTPDGRDISKSGITPDREVELKDEDRGAGKDAQLEAAFKELAG